MRICARLGAVVAASAVLVACGGTADEGDGTAAPTSATTSAPAAIVSPDQLDAGNLPTTPRPPLGTAGNPATGVVADAQHMADFVIGPWDVDEAAVTPYLASSFLLTSPQALEQLGPTSIAAAAGTHGMVNGFASARQATDRMVLVNAVLRFPDAAAASAAGVDMNAAAAQQQIQGTTPAPTQVPGHSDTVASAYPFTPHQAPKAWGAIRAFTPRGPYVLMQVAQSVDGPAAAANLVAKTIDLQGPLIDRFTPTPADAMADVPMDPTGLLARTLPAGAGTPATKNTVYSARGALHFQSNPVGSADLFKDNGVDAIAMAGTNVYQAKDEAAAQWVADSFGVEVDTEGVTPADPVPGLPASRCLTFPSGFYCVTSAGRYAIEVQAPQLVEAHQQVAAQYVMLTAHG